MTKPPTLDSTWVKFNTTAVLADPGTHLPITVISNYDANDNLLYTEAYNADGTTYTGNVSALVFPNFFLGTTPIRIEDTAGNAITTTGGSLNVNITGGGGGVVGIVDQGTGGLSAWLIHGTVSVSNFPATQTVNGTVAVSNFPAVQPVSGTFWQAVQPVSGTFWQAVQPVSGTVTAVIPNPLPVSQSGTWNIGTLGTITNPVPVTGTFWQATQPIDLTKYKSSIVGTANPVDTQMVIDGAVVSSFGGVSVPITGTVSLDPGSAAPIEGYTINSTTVISAIGQKASSSLLSPVGTGGAVSFYFGTSFAATHSVIFETTGYNQSLTGIWYPYPVREINDTSNTFVTTATGTSAQRTFVGPIIGPDTLVRARCTAFAGSNFSVTLTQSAQPYDQMYLPIPAGTNSIGQVTANAGTNLNTSALALDTTLSSLLTEMYVNNGAMAMQVDDAGGGVTYQGWAAPGTAVSTAAWRIRRIIETAGDYSIMFADGNRNFDNDYSNRAALAYS